ncbi:MAG: hypothetical protein IJX33_04740 [Akkermansia sp.]|nr:hypothetical protein [Akkermansia sp.]
MSKFESPCYGRVIIINVLCTAAAAGIAASQGAPILSTTLFIAVLMLLCNEAWYRAAALPALFVALIGQFRKTSGEKQEKRDRMALRLSSCVLLLVPHLIFGILYGADTLTQGKAAAELGICISHAVFACAFAAPALLWLIAQVGTVFPLSVEQIFVRDEFILDTSAPVDELPPVPQNESAPHPRHPKLCAIAGELLYYGRPEPGATNAHARTHATIGYCALPIVLILAALTFNSYEQSSLIAGVCGALAVMFGWVCYTLIGEPAAWQRKLSRVEYAFTTTHAYIAEGDELRTFTIDSTLNIQYEDIDRETGNLYLTQSGRIGTTMRKLMGGKLQMNDARSTSNLKAPLCGFFHIRNGALLCQQLNQLREQHESAS